MAIRYKALTELYHETQRSVTAPAQWQAFLASACRNYRLSFDEQLLVYAQRPDATAVLEIERWNKRFGRWVNRGANGIAVFDGEHTGRPRLKYYFDISDTHEGNFPQPIPLWAVRPEYEPEIIETLENSFGELEHKEDLGAALLSAAKNAVEDNIQDYLSELKTVTEGSFLEELDEYNVEVLYRKALENSIGYMLMVRCGLDPAGTFEDEDFRDVLNFNTPETLNALGVATGDISQMCLSEISRTVLALQRQPQKENRTFADQQKIQYPVTEQRNQPSERSFENERDHIHETGRLQPAEPSAPAGAGGSLWEIRIASEEVSERTPQDHLHEPVDQRAALQPSGGDRADGPAPDGADGDTDGQRERRDGGAEGARPDEVGRADEQPSERSGGDHTERADLQLISEPEQPSTLNAEEADSPELPAFLDEKQIMAVIANKDDDLKYKKQQIELFFSVHQDTQERADYLKTAYQDRYTEIIADGQRLGYKPQEDGLLMWEGSYPSRTKEAVFSWGLVAEWTAQLIDKKEYFIQTDIRKLPTQEGQQMSLFDFGVFSQPQSEGGNQISLFSHALPQQVIDEALCIGSNHENSRLTICAYFKKDKPDNARFLAEHYGENGAGFCLDGRKYAVWYNAEGIRIAGGESAQGFSATLISWEQAAARIRELLELGRYMPQSELDQVDHYEIHDLADRLLLMFRDIEDEEKRFFPSLRAIYDKPGGFPEAVEEIAGLLGREDSLQAILSEYEAFAAAYCEPLSLYTVVIAAPGERKSSVMRDMTTFLYEYEQEYNKAHSTEIRENHSQRESMERQISSLQKKLERKESREMELELRQLQEQLEETPERKPVRFFADDCSSEALTSLMAANNGVFSVISTEGGIFDIMAGRYSNKSNIDVWLKGHCGDAIYVDRMTREAECIMHPALSAILSIQPSVLDEIMSNTTMTGRGLIARFLYASPPSRIGSRVFRTQPIPPEITAAYRSLIFRLMARPIGGDTQTVHLSEKAFDLMADYFQEHEKFLVGEGQAISDWASKYIGAVLRIAGLLHCADMEDDKAEVTASTMSKAIQIGKYFLAHSVYAYSMMGTDLSIQKAKFVLARLKKKNVSEIKRSELFQMCRGKFFKKTEEIFPTLELLEGHGYIRLEEPERQSVGRPADVKIIVNPVA